MAFECSNGYIEREMKTGNHNGRTKLEIAEIAKRMNTTDAAIYHLISSGLRRIAQAGDAERFATVVRLTALEKAKQANMRCGSIECRPEKWVFFL